MHNGWSRAQSFVLSLLVFFTTSFQVLSAWSLVGFLGAFRLPLAYVSYFLAKYAGEKHTAFTGFRRAIYRNFNFAYGSNGNAPSHRHVLLDWISAGCTFTQRMGPNAAPTRCSHYGVCRRVRYRICHLRLGKGCLRRIPAARSRSALAECFRKNTMVL